MRTRRLLLLLVCLCVAGCPKKSAAQTAAYTRQFTVTSTAGRPVPGAKVYVCTGSVTVNTAVTPPCTPAATIYSDFALSTPITQPNIADAFGNVLYYVPAGTYTEVIVGNGITPSSVVLNFPSGGGATNLGQLNGGTSPSGQNYKYISPVSAGNVNGVISVDGTQYTQTCAGLQQALTDAAALGAGTVVDARGVPSTITCSTTLTMPNVTLLLSRGTALSLSANPGIQGPTAASAIGCEIVGQGMPSDTNAISGVPADTRSTLVVYTGSGIAFSQLYNNNANANAKGCRLANLGVVKSSASTGVTGVKFGGTEGFEFDHVNVFGFNGTGDIGVLPDNFASGTFTERTYFNGLWLSGDTTGLKFNKDLGNASFGHTHGTIYSNEQTGQTLVALVGGARLYGSDLTFNGNSTGTSCNGITVDATSQLNDTRLNWFVEGASGCTRFAVTSGGIFNVDGYIDDIGPWGADSGTVTISPPMTFTSLLANSINASSTPSPLLGVEFPGGVSSLDDIGVYNTTAATSLANQSSPALGYSGNFWTGTQSNQELCNSQMNFGTGANPTVNLSFGCSAPVAGSTGQHSISFSRGAGLTGQGTPWTWILPTDTFGITFNHALTANRPVSWPDFAGSVAIASGPFNLNDCLAVAAIDAGGFPQIGDAGPCGSGGGSPGGTNTAVQFNNSSAFGGDATNFNFNPTTHALTITGAMHTQNSSFALSQLVDGSFQGDTICADNTLTWNDCIGGVGGRTVTTTSDTLVSGDRQQQVTYNAASAVATSIGSAASLGNNYVSYLRNENAGTVTITPTTSTINGASSATLLEGYHATLTSPDNTNYFLDYSPGLLSAGTNITLTQTQFGTQISASGGSGGLSGMTAGQIPVAATASTVTSSKALAGTDSSIATTAGSLTNGALACGDSLGGVTTTGCTAGTGPNELNLTSVTGNMTATTTPTNVTGISMSVLANTTYIGQCFLQTSASAGTTQITWTGPASPTAVSFSGTLNASMGTAFGTLVNGTSSTTRQAQATVFYLENGANAGSIQLQFQNSSTGTSTMYAGSYCIIHQKGAN